MSPLLRAEWTKFRTVRGWVTGVIVAALMIVLFAVLAGLTAVNPGHGARPPVPLGPGGEPVTDSFYFVHRPLGGSGSITVAVASLHDMISNAGPGVRGGIVPWAKAGLIVTESTRQGSAYAAIMVTSGHGVRMQYDYTHDAAGLPGVVSAAAPRFLRLTRAGDAITGYDSADGTRWRRVGAVRLDGLPPTVQAGLFAACPPYVQGFGTVNGAATAVFGQLRLRGRWPRRTWSGEQVGGFSASFGGYPYSATGGGFTDSRGTVTVTGAGDLAPAVRGTLPTGGVVADLLTGTFAALIAVIVVAAMFITAEYRHGLIAITLAAYPRRGLVLVAKAVVLFVVTFLAGLAAAAVAVPLGERLARAKGVYLFPVTSLTELRVVVGTAALLAAAAVLALAVGAIVRRSAVAVTALIVAVVLPHIFVSLPFLPAVSQWLTRVTPVAAFAVQATLAQYPQVSSLYTPANGYYPLAPWAGLGVLYGYAALALGLAVLLLRRRDA